MLKKRFLRQRVWKKRNKKQTVTTTFGVEYETQ